MKNILKKSVILAILFTLFICNQANGTPINQLDFVITSSTTTMPTNYVYSTANTPNIKTQNSIKCIIISDGGGSTAPTFNGSNAPSGGKRWMAFSPDVDCEVEIGVMSNKKKFYIQSKDGEFYSYTNSANKVEEITLTGLKAGEWYAMCGGSSQVYITKMKFKATTPIPTVSVTGVTLSPNSLNIEQGDVKTLTATISPSDATNKDITWSSSDEKVATVDANGNVTAVGTGTATITVTTEDGKFTASCTVTVTAPSTPITLQSITFDKISLSLKEGETYKLQVTYTPNNATNKQITWLSSNATVASVSNDGTITALKAGTTTIMATSSENSKITAACSLTVTEASPVPSTTLSLHEPEVYESSKGYNTPLVEFDGRDYEVYYSSFDSNSNLSVTTVPERKSSGITTSSSQYVFKAIDNWFEGNLTDGKSDKKDLTAKDEFTADANGNVTHKLKGDGYYKLHIKGYDQFSFYGKDNNADASKGRMFEVVIDGVKQSSSPITSETIRRYNILTGEHVIELIGRGGSNNELYGFSLRVAYVPRVKHIIGNDSTQTVMQTQNLNRVTYYLKNKISDAELSWDGAEATGISLQKGENDTLYVEGTANCKNGTYKYTISAKDETDKVVSTISGKFTVSSRVSFQRMADTVKTVYEKSAIEPIKFFYYSIDKNDISWQWTGSTPAGLQFTIDESTHTITLGGTPTSVGTFTYTLSLKDGNTLSGKIIVESSSPTVVPGADKTLLYLYKSTKTNGIYNDITRKYNYFARTAGGNSESGIDYSQYDFIVISEDVDANNDEVLNIIQNVKKPVLNMKNFTYTTSRLDWGYPDNGSINNTKITVLQPNHPIFKGFNAKQGSEIEILKEVNERGLMPVEVDYQDTYALATALKQGAGYDEDGEAETFLHEVPQALRGAKYILFPLSQKSAANLNDNGKKLLQNVIDYLLSTEEPKVKLPELRITDFSVNGVHATIDENTLEIRLELPEGTDLTQLQPQITLADNNTKVSPESGAVVNLSDNYFGVDFTVSDYINRKVYTAFVTTATGLDDMGISGVSFDGTTLRNPEGKWLYIYNVSGILLSTTNSDFSFEGLPHSLYLIQSESGSMKIVK